MLFKGKQRRRKLLEIALGELLSTLDGDTVSKLDGVHDPKVAYDAAIEHMFPTTSTSACTMMGQMLNEKFMGRTEVECMNFVVKKTQNDLPCGNRETT